jgi:hypothetical protein
MDFSRKLMAELNDMEVIRSADAFALHDLGPELMEISLSGGEKGPRLLLTRDAGIDLAFRLADFLARLEAKEAREQER